MEVDSDEDLTKELQPLAYHVSDRKRVLREALKALKGKRLDAMIPPTLKTWDRNRLECACVEILEDVDDETLLAILDGRVSTAGVAAVEQPPPPIKVAGVKATKKLKKKLAKGAAVDGGDIELEEDEPKKKKRKKAVIVVDEVAVKNGGKIAKLKKKKKLLKAKAKVKVKKKKKAAAAASEEASAPAPHKSLMELLELEYRAKAIKALLRSQGQTVPDIPLNIDENSEDAENSKVVEQEVVKTAAQVNGATEEISKPLKVTTSEEVKTETTAALPKPKSKKGSSPEAEAVPVPKASPKKVAVLSSQKIHSPKKASAIEIPKKASTVETPRKASTVETPKKASTVETPKKASTVETHKKAPAVETTKKASTVETPKKASAVETPKKAVIDLIDEALNTSFSEETEANTGLNNDVIEPPSVIAEACTHKNMDSEALRNKLLLKYKKQKHRKIKKKPEPDLKDQEDILDLHPQELSLTDEEQAVGQDATSCTENDTSEYSESEPEVEVLNPDVNLHAEIDPMVTKHIVETKSTEEEELNYDEDSADDEVASTGKIQVDEVSQAESMEVDDIQDSNNSVLQTELEQMEKKSDEPEDAQISVSENTQDGLLSENSRSGMFSETTRDDVFEGAAVNSGFTQSLKRKITFRIDPARIGVLEEQGAEEEARKAEERKEIEKEMSDEEKEVEEGEIDSSEEAACGDGQLKSAEPCSTSTIVDKQRDLRDFLNRRHISHSVNTDEDTDESQDSTSYNSRRKTYRKTADSGTCSPNVDKSDKNDHAPKRPTSPVEFITQFSDMDPISEDSDHSESGTSKVASRRTTSTSATTDLPIQGCAEKPSGLLHDKITTILSNSNEKDLQSTSIAANLNHHNEDSQTSVTSETPSKSSIAEKAGSESGGEEDEDDLPKPVTWYERWAQSHGMQKVVKTNKIHKKVRTKLKQAISTKKKPIEMPKEEPSLEAEPIIGSIEEYEKLFGKKVVTSETEPVADQTDDPNKSEMETSNQIDNNDDDDADDLWGDILGGS